MSEAKIRLSPAEMKLVTNEDWILTKNNILKKVRSLLEGYQEKQQNFLLRHQTHLPAELFTASGKISKGENYRGLPYLILDYPRFFKIDEIRKILPISAAIMNTRITSTLPNIFEENNLADTKKINCSTGG